MSNPKRQRRASAIHLLPRATDQAVAEAIDTALTTGNKTQIDALEKLNNELKAMKLAPVSRSAWHRFITRLDEEGIPSRWRSSSSDAVEAGGTIAQTILSLLTELIDERIAVALRKRDG